MNERRKEELSRYMGSMFGEAVAQELERSMNKGAKEYLESISPFTNDEIKDLLSATLHGPLPQKTVRRLMATVADVPGLRAQASGEQPREFLITAFRRVLIALQILQYLDDQGKPVFTGLLNENHDFDNIVQKYFGEALEYCVDMGLVNSEVVSEHGHVDVEITEFGHLLLHTSLQQSSVELRDTTVADSHLTK